jgi:hypothetical protein
MMSSRVRNAVSVALLIVALVGAYLEYGRARLGIPGQHQLVMAAYIIIALYAATSIVLRMRAGGGR